MLKKFVVGSLMLGTMFVGAFGLFQIPSVKAAVSSMNVLKSVNVLGISVLQAGAYQLAVSNMTGTTGDQNVNLPALSGNNGMVYAVKQINANAPYLTNIVPANGDAIDNNVNQAIQLEDSGEYIQLIADTANGTWWVVSGGIFPY